MHMMTRVGDARVEALGDRWGDLCAACTLRSRWPTATTAMCRGPAMRKTKYIRHFPETREIWSFGSGYGGNALLGKNAMHFALPPSRPGTRAGWPSTCSSSSSPIRKEVEIYGGGLSAACGKTNLAMLKPTIPGWKVETIGDDIRWMKFGADGRLYAINPEAGFFGVAPGTDANQPQRHGDLYANASVHQRRADRRRRRVVGADEHPARAHHDWTRRSWTPKAGRPAAHPNARFTAPAKQCPVIAPEWEDPKGVPIYAILFGGRRATVVPLVDEALNWQHGTFLGSIMASEKTAAAAGKIGDLRRDPMAMLPFCGYHMGDYFAHWLKMGEKGGAKMPQIFYVNWFRKNSDGKFLWPGYGENSRVLKWIFERCDGTAKAVDTAIGKLPADGSLDVSGLKIAPSDLKELDQRRRGRLEGRAAPDQGAFRDLRREAPQGAQRGALRPREAAQLVEPRELSAVIALV